MYAVIATGGKQHRVQEGEQVHVELLDAEQGADVSLTPVLVVDGANVLATPDQLKGATVTAKTPQPRHPQAPSHDVKTATVSAGMAARGTTAHQDRREAPALDLIRTSSHPASIKGYEEVRCEPGSG